MVLGRPDFQAGGGKMAEVVAQKNWAETPPGPIEEWPQSLRTTHRTQLAHCLEK